MTSEFLLSDQKAFTFYGTFMALAYLTPVLGGWLSDQALGLRKAVLMGSFLVFMGCLCMSLPFDTLRFLGLALISVGVGFFKPNTISSVGYLFSPSESKLKDSAYTTLYVGMNLGSFIAPVFCGWVGALYGWTLVFPFLGISILWAGLLFHKTLKNQPMFKKTEPKCVNSIRGYGEILLLIPCVFFALLYAPQMTWLVPAIIVSSMGCLIFIFLKTQGQERRNVLQISLLMLLFALFSAVFEQIGSSITLFIDRAVSRTIFDVFTIPTPFFQSLNPAFVIALGPLIAGLWTKFEIQNQAVGIFGKFAIGFFCVGISFLVLSASIQEGSTALLSPLWIIFVFFLQVLGEICIVPIGFSAISTLAPKKFSGIIMGLWMVSIACGHYLAALIAKLSFLFDQGENSMMPTLPLYKTFFLQLSFIPLSAPVIVFLGTLYSKHLRKKS